MERIQNLHVKSIQNLPSPQSLRKKFSVGATAKQTVLSARETISNILEGKDKRLLVIAGPCSIHDPQSALEYAQKLNELKEEINDSLFIVMRTYFEKPRTTIGWKGFINDPRMDESCDMVYGLEKAREILLDIANMELPTATETLDPITINYISDLLSWVSIGARTVESQPHRELASGLSMPVGFKNNTNGEIKVAIDAIESARQPHSFLGVNEKGEVSIVRTKGNSMGHLVLRGGNNSPNCDPKNVENAIKSLAERNLSQTLVVDCSHGNSRKKHQNQRSICKDVVSQRIAGNKNIVGIMLESNLFDGSQKISRNLSKLRYGVSVTDECMGWADTEKLLRETYKAASKHL
ncbi:MAG: 3-deoxy-7-phosphoheptulonate synthase [Candidatus Schekmanbacteria bacterium RBG_16_38_11]|uniref:Phospho-2-dehydro-3-deoxyheptonate aldolase n=1 Tax=Candidatus Schekmanbacteria bacterium RBG_16_38_11 TaxID=1817880 RepID=A0A1F7RUL2_9BACT|nr:MAG: 3-deoxy-7-phosphoheptulonate synthase [Candidatus Schekmanbacteria bacterium RBG_16_38_11]